MTLTAAAIGVLERAGVPDPVARLGVGLLVAQADRQLAALPPEQEVAFALAMGSRPIAEHADAANAQHYDLPAEFFRLILGPRRKYSCCLYPSEDAKLAEAELHALEETAAHADLEDGQRILELGCGWGSLTLFMAERYPNAAITAVSNSASQRAHIAGEAQARGLGNVEVVTADMNDFEPDARFDRVVSVEMFEHMANWRALLSRVRSWLEPDGRLFVHVFTHGSRPYRFEHDKDDWIAQHFFTGGVMPSHGLIRQFEDLLTVEADWRWSGRHYERTALDWLARFDANVERINPLLADVYGADAVLWRRRWRLFFLATAGLFGHGGGTVWGVSHYRLAPA
jgi:cyclopropane-fatty-acyl-phospholipid synthase